MVEIYFDNSATTKPSAAVVEVMLRTLTEDYGNPPSMHKKAVEAEQ
jgi:cysteine desulfurase